MTAMVRRLLPALLCLLVVGCARPNTYVVLLQEEDGSAGAVTVTDQAGQRTVDQAGTGTGVGSGGTDVFTVPPAELRQVFGAALDAEPEPPVRFILYFKTDTSELRDESREKIPEVIQAIRRRQAPDVSVTGHTDRAGDADYNAKLAEERAGVVANLLVTQGLPRDMIDVESHGEYNPLIHTADGVHEPRNRRVEIIVR